MNELNDNKKLSSHHVIEGTRVSASTPVVPPCLSFFLSFFQSQVRRRLPGDTLPYCVVAKVERPLLVGYSAAWEPPTWAYLPLHGQTHRGFLRPAAHEGVLRRFLRSELSPYIGSLSVTSLILCSLNAGQSILYSFVALRITAG